MRDARQRQASARRGGGIEGCQTGKKKNPRTVSRRGFLNSLQIKCLAVTCFRIDKAETIIGAERFHFRVRQGIGWFPLSMAARQTGCKGRVMAQPLTIRTIFFDDLSQSVHTPLFETPLTNVATTAWPGKLDRLAMHKER